MPKCRVCGKEADVAEFQGYSVGGDCVGEILNLELSAEQVLSAFSYLDALRESGATNMLNSPRFLREEWAVGENIPLLRWQAKGLFAFWRETLATRAQRMGG